MDPERQRVQADLRGLIEGDVYCDDLFVQMYSNDASIYEVRPLGVVRPQSVLDVAACMKYAAENSIPVHARGAGSGLAGESLGAGLIIDFSHGMRRIVQIDDDKVRLQPGVVHAQLNRQLRKYRRVFGPDPATRSVTTMGSVIALDASGSYWPRYGSARDTVESLQIVTAQGDILEVNQHDVANAAGIDPSSESPAAGSSLASNLVRGEAAAMRGDAAREFGPARSDGSTSSALSGGNGADSGANAGTLRGRDGTQRPQLMSLVKRTADVIQRHETLIRDSIPKTCVHRCGYHLHDVLQNGRLNLARMLAGSEGTLALITEATLRTVEIPQHRGVVLLFFDRLEGAARGAIECAAMNVAACDLMDWRTLTIAREVDARFEKLIPREAEGMLLVEFQCDSPDEVRERMQQLVTRLTRRKRLAFDSRSTMETDERNLYWRLTRRVIPRLYRLEGSTRPLPFIEDIAVPPKSLPDFLVRLQNVFKSHQITASLFAHAGHGQLHVRPFLDLANPDDVRRMGELASDLYEHVLQVGGTICGEHAAGLSRTWFLRRQFGPVYDVFREIKRVFDPQNLLNPGKVIADAPQPLTKNLRSVPTGRRPNDGALGAAASDAADSGARAVTTNATSTASSAGGATTGSPPAASPLGSSPGSPSGAAPSASPGAASEIAAVDANDPSSALRFRAAPSLPVLQPQMQWQPGELEFAARLCNGCGRCRTLGKEERMCPIFRISPAEEASPRAKANLMRAVLTGRLPVESIRTEAFRDVARLCVNCHQCRMECPAGVDIPKLMIEAKAQYVATNGLTGSDWYLANMERLAAWGSAAHGFANRAIASGFARWMIEKFFGVAQGRKLPRFAARSFIRQAHRKRLTRPVRLAGRKALYFVDLYANWFDVDLAEATCRVLQHNGVSVYVPTDQLPSGMNRISVGDLDGARRAATHNVALLAEAVRQGYTIITSEPSSALCLTHEYPNLLDDEDVRLVADNTVEACSYLWRMHQSGDLELNLKPILANVAYHEPCHIRALGSDAPGFHLLELIPSLVVQRLDCGCSGMAGMYGLKRENFRTSLRAGWSLISMLREPSMQFGATECSACKMQMEQGTTKPTIHPLKLLAISYGVMPDLERLLTARGEELVVT